MQTDVRSTKPAGRLSREDQRKIVEILHRVYDEVLREGVPDRFKDFLDQFEESARAGTSQGTTSSKAFDNKGSRS